MTFFDRNGQMYGRYIANEAVPVVTYSYQQVTERIYVPKTVTENRTVTRVQYTPVYSYQPQLRNAPSYNPFVAPQQVWQYVPIVQYQPNYVTSNEPITFQRYEEKEVAKMVPVLTTQQQSQPKFVDRPIGTQPNGSNAIANDFYQQNAVAAQANRNTLIPTRPINAPYPPGYANLTASSMGNPNAWVAQAPQPYYVNPTGFNTGTPNSMSSAVGTNNNNMLAAVPNSNPTQSQSGIINTTVLTAVPLSPGVPGSPSYAAAYPNSAYQNPIYSPNGMPYNGYGPASYAKIAKSPAFTWPNFASGTGALFGNSLFSNNRNASYIASNTPVSQPYLWGNSNQGMNVLPAPNPYATPQSSWGMSRGNNIRDPLQGGMPATVLR